mgnify:CR=1 FL=1
MDANEKGSNLSISDGMKAIEEIISKLEEDIPLEESFLLYENGMKLLKDTDNKLRSLEARVEKINADGSLSEFEDID